MPARRGRLIDGVPSGSLSRQNAGDGLPLRAIKASAQQVRARSTTTGAAIAVIAHNLRRPIVMTPMLVTGSMAAEDITDTEVQVLHAGGAAAEATLNRQTVGDATRGGIEGGVRHLLPQLATTRSLAAETASTATRKRQRQKSESPYRGVSKSSARRQATTSLSENRHWSLKNGTTVAMAIIEKATTIDAEVAILTGNSRSAWDGCTGGTTRKTCKTRRVTVVRSVTSRRSAATKRRTKG